MEQHFRLTKGGSSPPILLYVTVPDDGQYLVYSDDGGESWKPYANMPCRTHRSHYLHMLIYDYISDPDKRLIELKTVA